MSSGAQESPDMLHRMIVGDQVVVTHACNLHIFMWNRLRQPCLMECSCALARVKPDQFATSVCDNTWVEVYRSTTQCRMSGHIPIRQIILHVSEVGMSARPTGYGSLSFGGVTAPGVPIVTARRLFHGVNNRRMESLNAKVRLIARRALGFHSAPALIALPELALGALCPSLPGREPC